MTKVKVRKKVTKKADNTDVALLVTPLSNDELQEWDINKIVDSLETELNLDIKDANAIAKSIEEKIINSNIKIISTSLVRELIDNELFERGMTTKLKKHQSLGMPLQNLKDIIFAKNEENSNILSNNPEAINLAISENILKQFALENIFSQDVACAHLEGKIHLHDLGYPTRVYCSAHSIEYIKKYGLSLCNLDTESAPANHAQTLTGHINTFLASMQSYYAGALGLGYVNIFYAPYLEKMSYEEMKQEAQYLIFSCSQNAFSRGSQSLFIDFNIHTGIPNYMKNIPAIGAGGKYLTRTYGKYKKTAIKFAMAMLDVWESGDKNGVPFVFPKCQLHINEKTFIDKEQTELLKRATQVASKNGGIYFVFDREEVTLSQCCRLSTTITDKSMLEHPESQRFCGFQNITINLPQVAYRVGKGNIEEAIKEIKNLMDLAVKAHLQKKRFIARLMNKPHLPLWEISKEAKDGKSYVDLEKATYIIGVIGLNECLQYLTGKELHEDEEIFKIGIKIISAMNLYCKELTKSQKLLFKLEESPAESASRRFVMIDLSNYPKEAKSVIRGDLNKDEAYYTNSIHLRANAPVDIITRIEKQSKFHTLIESGAIIHAFVGEKLPSAESILNLIQKTWKNTACSQLTISPEFTVCNDCKKLSMGIKDKCLSCNSTNVEGITRIVGYYSRVKNWNKSKLGELKDRQGGDYGI